MKLPKSMINALALAISSGLNFVALLLWTRLLSPGEFGVYALVSTTSLLVNAFAFEWLRQSGSRLLYDPADPEEIGKDLGNTLAFLCLSLAGLVGVGAVALWLAGVALFGFGPQWWGLVWLWVVSEMIFALTSVTARLRLHSWRFFLLMTARAALSLGLGVWLLHFYELGALGVVLAVIVAQFGVTSIAIGTDSAWRRLRPWRFDRVEVRKILNFGTPLILSAGLLYLSGIVDRYILSVTLGVEATGQYTVAADLMQKTIIFLMLAINITAYPQIVRTFETQGESQGTQALARNFVILLLVSLPVAVTFGVMSHGLARLFVGAAFEDSMALLLPWVALAAVMRGLMSFHLSVALQAVKKTRLLIAAPLITLAVLVPAGFVGVMLDGLRGMAISVALAQTTSFIIFAQVVGRHVDLPLLSRGSAAAVGLAAMLGLALLPFRQVTDPLLLSAVLGGAFAVYGGVLLGLKHARIGTQ